MSDKEFINHPSFAELEDIFRRELTLLGEDRV